MLRLLGVLALAGVALGCGRSSPLDDLELRRVEPGTRLGGFVYVLPDGRREPVANLSGSLWDREVEAFCVPSELSVDGRLRCFPTRGSTVQVYTDASCDLPLVQPLLGEGCPDPIHLSWRWVDGVRTELRSFRPTATPVSLELYPSVFHMGQDGCSVRGSTAGLGDEWVVAEAVPYAEMVGGEAERVERRRKVVTVTERYDDGTVAHRRELIEPCVAVELDGDPDLRRCVPDAERTSGFDYAVESIRWFADADCDEALTPGRVDRTRLYQIGLGGSGPNEVRELIGRLESPDEVYARTDDGSCRLREPGEEQPASVWHLGPVVPPATFVPVRRVEVGTGRLRPVRWVGPDGRAWPVQLKGSGDASNGTFPDSFHDAERDAHCRIAPTRDGYRCLPMGQHSESTSIFADQGCARPAMLSYDALYSHLSVLGEVDPGTGTWCSRAVRGVVEVRRLGPPRSGAFWRWQNGGCRRDETPDASWRVQELLEEVPVTAFPEVTREPARD